MIKLKHLSSFAFFCVMLSLSTAAYGQMSSVKYLPEFRKPVYKAADRDVKAGIDINAWVDETSKDINRVRPGAFTPNPTADRAVVRSVFQSLKTKREGFSDEAILKAVFYAWIELAIKGYDKSGQETNYTEADLLNQAANMSELNIQTKPDGATIQVDNYEKSDKSNTSIWIAEGEHMLVLKKPGYVRYSKNIKVDSPKPMSLDVTLQPVK